MYFGFAQLMESLNFRGYDFLDLLQFTIPQ